MSTKPIRQSKTVWLNVITSVIAVLAFIPQFVTGLGMTPETADLITKITLAVSGVLNIVLRVFFTTEPVGK